MWACPAPVPAGWRYRRRPSRARLGPAGPDALLKRRARPSRPRRCRPVQGGRCGGRCGSWVRPFVSVCWQ
ncbi:hypothetical protein EYF88_03830 [Paracoccus sediminis]|uniref:Uncharacterized protein n=1 Tax=Paracoccus sediminis TaxID=1214787 RepID=A0ABY1YN30_9RHOB|nr:hypothetical protein EYF88_03830 [Paracoccus sediminis]